MADANSTDVKKLNTQRFVLAIVSVAGLIAAGVGVFLVLSWGKVLDAVAVGLLTLLVRELGGGKSSAFAWFFDGSADKPPPAPGTSTTTSSAPVQPSPELPVLNDVVAVKIDDSVPVKVEETKP